MKTLRNFALVFALAAVTLTGCKKEGCTNEQSDNYDSEAKKDDGTCVPWRSKFIATYGVVESCSQLGNFNYDISISTSSAGETTVLINNFFDFNITVSATVNGNSISIPNQTVSGVTYSGSGQINGNILTLTYNVSESGFSDSCTATCTKK